MTNNFATAVTLFLAIALGGAASANEERVDRCGKHMIYAWGHHGFEFYLLPKDAASVDDVDDRMRRRMRRLPGRLFRVDDDGNLHFRSRKCKKVDDYTKPRGDGDEIR